MAKQKLYGYEVTGYGVFPLDMLRYDSAWPYSSRDVEVIRDYAGTHAAGSRELWRVRLTSISEPTVGRWKSFNVQVNLLRD